MRIQIINGPNLNILGKREPEVYGRQSFDLYFNQLTKLYTSLELDYYQSNIEGEIIDMKYQVAISVYREEQIFCFSCMIIYN